MEWVDSQIPTPVSPPAGREGWVKYETATDITLTPALSLKGEGATQGSSLAGGNDHGLAKVTSVNENALAPGSGNHKGCPYDWFAGAYFHSNDEYG